MKTTVYNSEDIRKIVLHFGLDQLMDDAIHALSEAFREFDPASSAIPSRDGFDYCSPEIGLLEWMPAMQSGADVVLKVVGYHPGNPGQRGLPTILSSAMSYDTRTGQLLALLDATFLTALRTGAASAIASRLLARRDSRTLGLVGAGAQAVTQLHGLSRVFDLQRVIVYDLDEACAASLPERAGNFDTAGIEFSTGSLSQLVAAADIICTATSVEIGGGPVFEDNSLHPWVHVNAVGSDFPGKFEIPKSLLERSLVCPDFLEQALYEGECQQLGRNQIGPGIVALLKDPEQYSAYRERSTIFDSTGWAYEDYVLVNMLIDRGRALGCGTEIELTNIVADPKSPYAFVTSQDTGERTDHRVLAKIAR